MREVRARSVCRVSVSRETESFLSDTSQIAQITLRHRHSSHTAPRATGHGPRCTHHAQPDHSTSRPRPRLRATQEPTPYSTTRTLSYAATAVRRQPEPLKDSPVSLTCDDTTHALRDHSEHSLRTAYGAPRTHRTYDDIGNMQIRESTQPRG